ncbi:MAG: hypothetical protein JXB50_12300 [Spirochaetes bacterium]|nr:hypothetical protein [Spirochaetota bacterium]
MIYNRMLNPYLIVKISGKEVKNIGFTLITMKNSCNIQAKLFVPKTIKSSLKDEVEVSLGYHGQDEWKIFKGFIDNFYDDMKMKVIILKDGNTDFWGTKILESYRKEKAKNILNDCLEKCKIDDTKITIPEVEFDRFLICDSASNNVCRNIIETLYSYGTDKELQYFFDENNVFHFGSIEDTGKNEGEAFNFDETNVLKYHENGFETFALPVRHSQKIKLNDSEIMTLKTVLTVMPKNTKLEVYY